MTIRSVFMFSAALMTGAAAHAHDYTAGKLRIEHPYARATVPGQPAGAAYLTIENRGKNPDKLVALASPLAGTVEIHSMTMDGNVMKMREVPSLEIPPAAKIALQPGAAYHIMLIGLSKPLKAGDAFPLTLTFEKAGKAEVSVHVEDNQAKTAK